MSKNKEEEEKEEESSEETCARSRVWTKKKKKRIVRRKDESVVVGETGRHEGAIIGRLDHSYHHVLSTPRSVVSFIKKIEFLELALEAF